MTPTDIQQYRHAIAAKVRRLREEHRRTQSRLARLLGVSQNWLSDIEHGKGSLSAEQFLLLLKSFNVTAESFLPYQEESSTQIQNALANLGARHMPEVHGVPPAARLRGPEDTIRAALAAADSPGHIAAVAPVLVEHARTVDLDGVRARLAQSGLEGRLGWALENTLEALRRELGQRLGRGWRAKYREALAALGPFLAPWKAATAHRRVLDDILDSQGLLTDESIEHIRLASSDISRRWSILTRIEIDDFVQALRASRTAARAKTPR